MDFMSIVDLILVAGLVMFVVSIPFYLKNRTTLEEKGFPVKQILIDSAIAIFLIILLLFVIRG
jgi:hypothetical protein